MRARPKVGQARRVDLFQARAVDHDDRGQLCDMPGLAPLGKIGQTVGADQKK